MERALRAVIGASGPAGDEIAQRLDEVRLAYPTALRPAIADDAPRVAEHAAWVSHADSVLDVGGGFGPFAPLCTALGARAAVVDSFDHEFFSEWGALENFLADRGIELVRQDAVREPLPFPDASFDAVTSFDSMEHWHHSPRRLFAEIVRVTRPGGLFVLGVPNAVNARKRLAVPLGRSNWSRFEDWYGAETFHGHVREPTVGDLRRIAGDMRLRPWTIVGRNWLGFRREGWLRTLARVVDRPLRIRPSLCANIYLVGRTSK